MKSLEAFEKLCDNISYNGWMSPTKQQIDACKDIVEKHLKAAEIIFKKEVDVHQLIGINFDYDWFIAESDGWEPSFILTKEEMKLLKEVYNEAI